MITRGMTDVRGETGLVHAPSCIVRCNKKTKQPMAILIKAHYCELPVCHDGRVDAVARVRFRLQNARVHVLGAT